jgi:hypothetical protein
MFSPPIMLVNPSDLRSVRVECPRCHSAISYCLDSGTAPHLHNECVNCGESWLSDDTQDRWTKLESFLKVLGAWLVVDSKSVGGPAVSFELSPMGIHGGPPAPPRP